MKAERETGCGSSEALAMVLLVEGPAEVRNGEPRDGVLLALEPLAMLRVIGDGPLSVALDHDLNEVSRSL